MNRGGTPACRLKNPRRRKEVFKIVGMTKEELIALDPQSVDWSLSDEETFYIAKTLGAYWGYNYEVAKKGRSGLHAILKSGLHSDGFFVSAILLEHPNIRWLFANQMVLKFKELGIPKPDWIAGIPKGATELGKDVARIMGVKNAKMIKGDDGRIVLESSIAPDETLLGVEDFSTRGTGFREAVLNILSKQPKVKFLPYYEVILNRGGLTEVEVEGIAKPFRIVSVAVKRINDWSPPECPPCNDFNSKPIKPKATDENWRLITTSQQ